MQRMSTSEPTLTPTNEDNQEFKVNFYPELFLQRRIWILNVLRKEGITKVLDIGCGEGQLLNVLSQPAPWLPPPPPDILPPSPNSPLNSPNVTSPTFKDDGEIANLHMTHIYGLDISKPDLEFAVQAVTPQKEESQQEGERGSGFRAYYVGPPQRWEDTEVKVWLGGLEVINEDFVGMECIVSTEVIEHLPPSIFPYFAPMLLGVYHPKFLLITTPSYTFNARWTSPFAPPSARSGFKDPTGRTDRIFRHSDHKFEWTKQEFKEWCDQVAKEWGYEVYISSIGRALDPDPFGRDEELEGASLVASFKRIDSKDHSDRELRGREVIRTLGLIGEPHALLASFLHTASPSSMKPKPLPEIASIVKAKMETYREAFMRVEELWFERDVASACGGWIEYLVRAVEESSELVLKREMEGAEVGRSMWTIELVGGVGNPQDLWHVEDEAETSADLVPPEDWTPGEGSYESSEGDEDGVDADISWGPSAEEDYEMDGDDEDTEDEDGWRARRNLKEKARKWGIHNDIAAGNEGWASGSGWGAASSSAIPGKPASMTRMLSGSSTEGWDGDESDDHTG